jgi:hypothetical protein
MENMGTWSVDDDHWMEDWMENEENGWLVMNIGWKIGWEISENA